MKGHNHLDREAADLLASYELSREENADRRESMRKIVGRLRVLLVGRQVIHYGRRWQVVGLRLVYEDEMEVTGVTVSKRGKIGRRQFNVGSLRHCELVE